jgi:selenocysteine lyase/cysteine desulfurase
VAFGLAGHPADQVARGLGEQGVFVSSGDFYAPTVLQRLGVPDGLVRAGCACYTTTEEVDRLIEEVRRISG